MTTSINLYRTVEIKSNILYGYCHYMTIFMTNQKDHYPQKHGQVAHDFYPHDVDGVASNVFCIVMAMVW
jgi:hypothetical protein